MWIWCWAWFKVGKVTLLLVIFIHLKNKKKIKNGYTSSGFHLLLFNLYIIQIFYTGLITISKTLSLSLSLSTSFPFSFISHSHWRLCHPIRMAKCPYLDQICPTLKSGRSTHDWAIFCSIFIPISFPFCFSNIYIFSLSYLFIEI